jgi:hypothetical protein
MDLHLQLRPTDGTPLEDPLDVGILLVVLFI